MPVSASGPASFRPCPWAPPIPGVSATDSHASCLLCEYCSCTAAALVANDSQADASSGVACAWGRQGPDR